MANSKYGIKNLRKEFGSEEKCLEFIFMTRHTKECSCGGEYHKIAGRKQYQCSKCRFQIAPTAGTIFHKSDTPLSLWFHAIMVFSNAKSGISAKELERQLAVTYKTAWRMLKRIREALGQGNNKLKGEVEVDTGYIGGTAKLAKRMHNKSTVFAAIERGGDMKASVVPDGSAEVHKAFLELNVEKDGTRLLTDDAKHYRIAAKEYKREAVNHNKEYVRGDVHINHVENFWSHVKRSIKGTHKNVSAKHLQSYLDGFVFHANNRDSDIGRFYVLIGALLQPKLA
jgi:transposase